MRCQGLSCYIYIYIDGSIGEIPVPGGDFIIFGSGPRKQLRYSSIDPDAPPSCPDTGTRETCRCFDSGAGDRPKWLKHLVQITSLLGF